MATEETSRQGLGLDRPSPEAKTDLILKNSSLILGR